MAHQTHPQVRQESNTIVPSCALLSGLRASRSRAREQGDIGVIADDQRVVPVLRPPDVGLVRRWSSWLCTVAVAATSQSRAVSFALTQVSLRSFAWQQPAVLRHRAPSQGAHAAPCERTAIKTAPLDRFGTSTRL